MLNPQRYDTPHFTGMKPLAFSQRTVLKKKGLPQEAVFFICFPAAGQ
jgi:hypothetical protein